MLTVETALLTFAPTVVAALLAPMAKVVATVVVPPVMLSVALVLLPTALAPLTVFTPMVTAEIAWVPPEMLTVELALPVDVAVDAELVLIVSVPIVEVPPPKFSVPVTLPVVALEPVRLARFTVVASRVPVPKVNAPVPLPVACALRPPMARVPSSRSAEWPEKSTVPATLEPVPVFPLCTFMSARPLPARLRMVTDPVPELKSREPEARLVEPPMTMLLAQRVFVPVPSLMAWMTVLDGESCVMVVARMVLVGARISVEAAVALPPVFVGSPMRRVPVPRLA